MNRLEFRCCVTDKSAALPHFWEHTAGSGHAPLALRADWQRQLRQCHDELGFRHVRFHDLLSDDMGTLVDERDQFRYSFFNADQICDFLVSIGMKPFIELSFMPAALSSGNTTVQKPMMTSPFSHWNAFGCKWRRYGPVLHPDFEILLAKAISARELELGVAICGSGVGASSAANQVPGVKDRIGHRRVSSGARSDCRTARTLQLPRRRRLRRKGIVGAAVWIWWS
jgi:hypothetical protein